MFRNYLNHTLRYDMTIRSSFYRQQCKIMTDRKSNIGYRKKTDNIINIRDETSYDAK